MQCENGVIRNLLKSTLEQKKNKRKTKNKLLANRRVHNIIPICPRLIERSGKRRDRMNYGARVLSNDEKKRESDDE